MRYLFELIQARLMRPNLNESFVQQRQVLTSLLNQLVANRMKLGNNGCLETRLYSQISEEPFAI